jgi:toxin ParE1/3/4
MTELRVSPAALADLEDLTLHYLDVAGLLVAGRFNDAWLDAQVLLGEHPLAGSGRVGALVGNPDLRALPFRGFPYLIFYRTLGDEVFILRILHTARDIPASLRP